MAPRALHGTLPARGPRRRQRLGEAFREIRSLSRRRVALVLVGDGPAAPSLRRAATPDIRFTGYLRGVELAEAFAAGDVFVFPSDTETFGNVVTEAMASGLPVVAPAEGGVTETVREGETGILVPPRDARALARATLSLLHDDALRERLGRGRAEAERRSWPVHAARQKDEARLSHACYNEVGAPCRWGGILHPRGSESARPFRGPEPAPRTPTTGREP